MEDHQAIPLAAAGDQRAFGVLIRRYEHMVYTAARRVLRNDMDAEEVTQDVFVKAFQQLHDFQGAGKFSTWLYSIAYRTAISALRRRKDDNTSLEELQASGKEPGQAPTSLNDDRRAILEWALSTLPAEDAGVMTMFYLDELSVEEIVTVTGLGASNVKVKLHRSRKRMFELLQLHLKEEAWTLTTNE